MKREFFRNHSKIMINFNYFLFLERLERNIYYVAITYPTTVIYIILNSKNGTKDQSMLFANQPFCSKQIAQRIIRPVQSSD